MIKKLLLVEDDADFGFMLKQYLEYSEFEVDLISDPRNVDNNFTFLHRYDLAILDLMMPYISGFTLASQIIKTIPDLPIIFLTAKDQKIDKLTGLKIGADDYLTKPCDPEELILRIQNIIKRTKSKKIEQRNIQLGTYQFDAANMLLIHPYGNQQLTEREAGLLNYLFQNKDRIISREEILEAIWGNNDFFSGRSMDVFISRLRKYLQHDPSLNIQAIRSIGFKVKL